VQEARKAVVDTGRWTMSESLYKVIELVGSSEKSWEDAAKNAVDIACKSIKDLRIAEVKQLDMKVENGKVVAYRARVSLSFRYDAAYQKNWSEY